MHQNPKLTNKVSMKILNLKVVNQDRLSKFFKLYIGNLNLVTVNGNKCVANFKITCRYPTLVLNIERVVCGSVNGLTFGSKDIENERIWLSESL